MAPPRVARVVLSALAWLDIVCSVSFREKSQAPALNTPLAGSFGYFAIPTSKQTPTLPIPPLQVV